MVLERHRHHRLPHVAAIGALTRPVHRARDLLSRPQLVDARLVGAGVDPQAPPPTAPCRDVRSP